MNCNFNTKYCSVEEKGIILQSSLKKDVWNAISFKSFSDFFSRIDKFELLNLSNKFLNQEKIILFFLDFFDILLRSRLLTFTQENFCLLKRKLNKYGVQNILKDADKLFKLVLKSNDQFGNRFVFSPDKILEKILYGQLKDFTELIGCLTNEDYPQETNLYKWIVTFSDTCYEREC